MTKSYQWKDQDIPYLSAFRAWTRVHGWDQESTEGVIEWAATAIERGVPAAQLRNELSGVARSMGLSGSAVGQVLEFHRTVTVHGPESFPMPDAGDDARRREKIERIMRDDPEAYYASNMSQELMAIVSRQEAQQAGAETPSQETLATPTSTAAPAATPGASPDGEQG